MIPIIQCFLCAHYLGKRRCKAFDKIPNAVLIGDIDHHHPIEGDHGITFEEKERL